MAGSCPFYKVDTVTNQSREIRRDAQPPVVTRLPYCTHKHSPVSLQHVSLSGSGGVKGRLLITDSTLFMPDREVIAPPVKLRDGPMDVELFKASIEAGRNAIKAGFLVNGAGAISILTLLGGLAKDAFEPRAIHSLALPLGCFAFGVAMATGATGLTFLAQAKFQNYGDPAEIKSGVNLRHVIILLMFLSYAAFVVGCATSYHAFVSSF
jgi:hypothetical protein